MCFILTCWSASGCLKVKLHLLREGGQQLRPQHVEALINKQKVLFNKLVLNFYKCIVSNKDFELVTKFRYLSTTLTHRNWTHGEIKSRLKSGNACYHSVRNFLSPSLLSKI